MHSRMPKSKGAALVTSLILLMALTMVSLAAIQTTAVQVQISSNDQLTIEADQYAQSVIDNVIENSANFPVSNTSNYTICAVTGSGCNATGVTLSDPMFSTSAVGINPTDGVQAKVQYLKTGTTPRMAASAASSANSFKSAYFSITGSYDKTGTGGNGGKSTIVQGFIFSYPQN